MTTPSERAREIALMIHDDFTLQIGEPVAHAHIDAFLACMEAHIAAALTTQAETIRRLEGEVAKARVLAESAKSLMKHAAQRAEAAEGLLRELLGVCPVLHTDLFDRISKHLTPSPATGEGA